MKKMFAVLMLVAILSIALFGCKKNNTPHALLDDPEALLNQIAGTSQDEVHELLGDPAGRLSGFWGDIYYNSADQFVNIYYDSNGNVETIKVTE